MKKSYKVYSVILLTLVVVMVVGGLIQDYRSKKSKVRKAAIRTMVSVGATQVDDDYIPVISDGDVLGASQEVDLSVLDSVDLSSLSNLEGKEEEASLLFKKVAGSLLKDARFKIISTNVSGRDAEVKIHIYYKDHEGELDLEYFYYDGDWMLANTVEAVKNLTVDGRDYDEAEAAAFEKVVSEFQNSI